MSLSSRIRTWWRAVTRRAELNDQLDEELRFHIESYTEDLMNQGLPREEAMRRAKAELGNVTAVRENSRQAWGTRWFDELRGDLRYAWRMLAKSPGFAVIAIGSLALGIGANTAIFSIAKHVLLDRLNVPHPEQLRLLMWTSNRNSAVHSIWGDWNSGYDGVYSTSFSYPVYEVLRKQNRGLEDVFAFKDAGRMDVTIDGQAEVVQSELVSGNYYEQMHVQPQLGRLITAHDDQIGATPVAVISDEYWAKRFNRSPSVIGRTIFLNLTPTTIVGVSPRGFTGAKSVQSSPDIFAPVSMEPQLVSLSWEGGLLDDPNRWWVQIMARTKPGGSAAAAQAQLSTTLHEAVVALMKPNSGDTVPRLLLRDGSRGMNEAGRQLGEPLMVLLAMAGMVLVLACANLANLLLARSTARQREMSVRLALGARRSRIMRQMLTEALLLTVFGGALGLLVGYLGRNALLQLTADPSSEAAPMQAAFNWGIFAFNAGLSLVTGILFGFAPAWRATRTNVQSSLKESAQTTTRRRHGYTGKAIVAFQIAVSMLLVAGAGVFLRTLINLYGVDPGFDTRNLVLFQVSPPKSRYPVEKQVALYGNIEKRLATIPGVEAVSAESIPLLANDRSNDDFVPTGMKRAKGEDQTELDNYVGDQYFATLRIPMLAGRTFTVHDTANSTRVAVVNEALAKKYWTVGSAIGKTFRTTDIKQNKLLYTIVGVCANTHYSSLRDEPPPIYYLSYRQAPDVSWGMTFAVKSRTPRAAVTPSLRTAVSTVDRDLPLMQVRTQQEQIDQITASERVFAELTAGFGVLALVLACIGIYGIMAYSVSQRTNEIGIRMALGAGRERVLRMVLGEASWITTIGMAAGLGGALALGRLIASMLYGIKSWDPATFALSLVLLIIVALGASWIPARRAAGTDPMRALRHE